MKPRFIQVPKLLISAKSEQPEKVIASIDIGKIQQFYPSRANPNATVIEFNTDDFIVVDLIYSELHIALNNVRDA